MQVSQHLPRLHFFLALAVMAVWGSNFVVIKLALVHLPPLLLAALRFSFAFLPAAFFIKRPNCILEKSCGLRRADRGRTIWPSVSGNEGQHHAGALASLVVQIAGIFHDRAFDAVERRTSAPVQYGPRSPLPPPDWRLS